MKIFLKTFLYFCFIVYAAQVLLGLFSNDADKWSRWITFEFHLGLLSACLFAGAVKWAYERINNNKQ